MGFFDRFRRTTTAPAAEPAPKKKQIYVGAGKDNDNTLQSFDNTNFTFNGELADYDYVTILRNKQENIISLYQLADYYTDADAIVHGIIKHVFVPFSICSGWFLTGSKEKTYELYEQQYKRMRLREKIQGIFLELWKYNNVCCYLKDGDLITLPVHKWRIGNVTFNGTPIVEYDCQDIINNMRIKAYSIKEEFVKDSERDTILKGYPEEVQEAVKANRQYAQLDPAYTFVLQGSKEGWMRYAIPFIAAALPALAKKELISSYEDAMLNIGKRSFVHVKYGESDKTKDILPDITELNQVRKIFQSAMSGTPLAVTNHLATAEVIQADMDDLFQWDKYSGVNNDILASGGISGVMVTGISQDGSTFASAQVSIENAEARINAARDEFCEMMTKINERLAEFIPGTYNLKEIPEFHFEPLSIEGKKALREKCTELWKEGAVSTRTMMKTNGYSIEVESKLRQQEASDGTDELLMPREVLVQEDTAPTSTSNSTDNNKKSGRPKLDNSDRKSDPEASSRGRQPKPSRPEGSEPQDDTG